MDSKDSNKLAIEVMNIILSNVNNQAILQGFRGRARSLIDSLLEDFFSTFGFIIAKAEIHSEESREILLKLNFLDMERVKMALEDVNNLGKEKAGYLLYLIVILYFLTKTEIISEKDIVNMAICNKTTMDIYERIYENSVVIQNLIRRYLIAVKNLATGLIGEE
ncbi:type III-B CRISPR module-associated protein Cmr5 [Sulfolobus sp. E5-1-F]|uniref:type III-B CRISPR module-associated protein Cmr5 n=1 Tax=Saccharolobus sp. E5-1-F TaxID=2663019 RepID=UPI001296BD4E|nr:type III-B CRISPR module-associated protein Cmr5 [Sulfolobus sp. E5-1-F]QGA53823.1 type III-B CRISPR module-associated protein Cmr5 [Sulfolobus sp. E5-1-F]